MTDTLPGKPTTEKLARDIPSMLVGLVLSRCLLKVPTLAETEWEHFIRIVAPAIQAVISPGDSHAAEALTSLS